MKNCEASDSDEAEKAAVDSKSPVDGKIVKYMAKVGETVLVGNECAVIDETAQATAETKKEEKQPEAKPQEAKPEPAKEEAKPKEAPKEAPKPAPKAEPKPMPKIELPTMTGSREIRKVPMRSLRDTAAKRSNLSQITVAM